MQNDDPEGISVFALYTMLEYGDAIGLTSSKYMVVSKLVRQMFVTGNSICLEISTKTDLPRKLEKDYNLYNIGLSSSEAARPIRICPISRSKLSGVRTFFLVLRELVS